MGKKIIALVFALAAVGASAQNGVIKELTGTVELKKSGSAEFTAAKTGDAVAQDTVVSTALKSTVLIEVGSAILTVRPLTRLTLKEIRASSEGENVNVSLQSGRVRVDVKPPAGSKANLTVQSPSATASVRGTSFEFDARNLYVISGNVAFKGTNGEYTLITAGSESAVGEKGSAENPLSFGNDAYLPQMPVGTQAYASPAPLNAKSGQEIQDGGFGVGIGY